MDSARPISADSSDSVGVDLLGMVQRHWWLILLLVLIGVGGAAEFTHLQPKVYESSTSVLVHTYAAADPRAAQAGSHAFAESYLRNREETARADLTGQIATLDAKVKELNAALAAVNSRLAQIKNDSPERPNLESQRSTVAN